MLFSFSSFLLQIARTSVARCFVMGCAADRVFGLEDCSEKNIGKLDPSLISTLVVLRASVVSF